MLPSLPVLLSQLAYDTPMQNYMAAPRVPHVPVASCPPAASNPRKRKTEILHPQYNQYIPGDIVEIKPSEREDKIRVIVEISRSAWYPKLDSKDLDVSFPYKANAPKKRQKYTPHVLKILKDSFAHNPNPSNETKQALVEKTNKTFAQIDVWFSNRRKRLRKR